MKKVEEYFVPWLKGVPMYISSHIELAWKDKSLKRLMSNENPNPPSKKVQKALSQYAAVANRYMDQGLLVRGKIAELNGLAGPENVLVGNGSSEVFDMIFRSFLQVGDEVIQHTPCFGIYKLRCVVCGGKLVSVPMRYENKKLDVRRQGGDRGHHPEDQDHRHRQPQQPHRQLHGLPRISWPSPRPGFPSSWTRPTSSTPAWARARSP